MGFVSTEVGTTVSTVLVKLGIPLLRSKEVPVDWPCIRVMISEVLESRGAQYYLL